MSERQWLLDQLLMLHIVNPDIKSITAMVQRLAAEIINDNKDNDTVKKDMGARPSGGTSDESE